MKEKTRLIVFLAVFLLAAVAGPGFTAQARIPANSTVSAIEINGSFFVPQQEITDAIFSKVGEPLLQEKVSQDLKAIYALGYFSDVTVNYRPFKRGTKIIFTVQENPIITKIQVDGNRAISTIEIKSIMQTKAGKILNFKVLQSDIKTINNYYQQAGYMLARIVDTTLDEKNHVLTIKIVEGNIESIAIEGNESTKDYVIIREMNTRPDSVLNEKVLSKDLRRIFNLGFFSEVTPDFVPGSTPDKIGLLLKIKENRASSINFGGGYGEREGWFGFVDLSINNLMGTGRSMLIRGQSGQELSTYQFKYNEPWLYPEFFGDHASFTFRRWFTYGKDVYLSQQDEIHNGWDVELGRPLWGEYIRGSVVLGSEKVDPYDTATFEAYLSDSIGFNLSYDTRDYWLNPASGVYYTLSLKEGWTYAGSGNSGFFKVGIDANHYNSLGLNQVLAMHAGTGIGFGAVPIGELYWVGGSNTVRGYYPTEARIGRRRLLANVEYRYTFNEVFQGVFFFDWGNAWDEGFVVPTKFLTGWGPGIRLNTPLGPIRLDYGVPSGANFGQGIIHFSIGQAF